jgi:hypothetical protein
MYVLNPLSLYHKHPLTHSLYTTIPIKPTAATYVCKTPPVTCAMAAPQVCIKPTLSLL